MASDWYPTKIELLPEWHTNYALHLPTLQAKYGITNQQIQDAEDDKDWIVYWVNALISIQQQLDQIEQFFQQIWKLPKGSPQPLVPAVALPPDAPAVVFVGVRSRTREIAKFIKGNPGYAKADGELLGIVTATSLPPNFGQLIADFKVRTLANFDVEIVFKKQGADGIRIEFRYKGGEWIYLTTLTSSPGVVHINPQVAGVAEQLEMRGIMIEKNQPVGNFSDTKTAFIAP